MLFRALRPASEKDDTMTATTLDRPSPSGEGTTASIHLEFSSADAIHEGLDRAVQSLIEPAREANCGILVTRTLPGRYIVAVDESVPFGETYENIAA